MDNNPLPPQLLFHHHPYPRLLPSLPYNELLLTVVDEEQGGERIQIIPNSQPDRPRRQISIRYYYWRCRQLLLTRDLWYPDLQDWGANYSIKMDRIPRQWFRLDCDGAYKRPCRGRYGFFRGGYGFVLRDSGYNPIFGGYGKSSTAVDSLYHEVEAIHQGLKAVIDRGWTDRILIYSDNREAIQMIRGYDPLLQNQIRQPLRTLVGNIDRLLKTKIVPGGYQLEYHCREGNFVADYLSKKGDVRASTMMGVIPPLPL